MKNIFVVFESGIDTNEWWYLDTFEDYDDAKEYIDTLTEDSISTKYKITEYMPK